MAISIYKQSSSKFTIQYISFEQLLATELAIRLKKK